ncbi:MAG: hypothetical protein KBG15_09155 [Kofleriaceae bacterium]|nr:hypothetical protein [Kofleriaceae bacterium]
MLTDPQTWQSARMVRARFNLICLGFTWLALMSAASASSTGCALRTILIGRANTGTCAGACDRYLECSATPPPTTQNQCLAQCPDALGPAESIRHFESLECDDVVRYVDGPRARVRQ